LAELAADGIARKLGDGFFDSAWHFHLPAGTSGMGRITAHSIFCCQVRCNSGA
jgi:hypothetical protein